MKDDAAFRLMCAKRSPQHVNPNIYWKGWNVVEWEKKYPDKPGKKRKSRKSTKRVTQK